MSPPDRSGAVRTIGIDIGGTKVSGGVVDHRGRVVASARRDTPSTDPRAVEDVLVDVVRELTEDGAETVAAVGIGAAGFIDETGEVVVFSPHLSWRQEPLRQRLADRLPVPVVIENDANCAAWAEHRFGAGREESRLLCLTLGTGIGGGIVAGGVLDRGRFGMAGEFGHMVLVPGGHRCECGNRGCWEQYCSGNALGREGRELARAQSPVAQDLLGRVGGDAELITGAVVTAAAREGDAEAVELMAEMGRNLGQGLASLVSALDPGTVVIGGGLSQAGELLLAPARQMFRRMLPGRGFRTEPLITVATLGPRAGLIGAADLARQAL